MRPLVKILCPLVLVSVITECVDVRDDCDRGSVQSGTLSCTCDRARQVVSAKSREVVAAIVVRRRLIPTRRSSTAPTVATTFSRSEPPLNCCTYS